MRAASYLALRPTLEEQAQHFRSSNTYSDIGLPDTSPDDFLKKRILGDSVVTCSRGHELSMLTLIHLKWGCNVCLSPYSYNPRLRCSECDFDLCNECAKMQCMDSHRERPAFEREASPARQQMQMKPVSQQQPVVKQATRQVPQTVMAQSVVKSKTGVGMVLERESNGQVFVRKLMRGSPAANAGSIQINDKVLTVDGNNVQGMPLDRVFDMINGPEGTQVNITLVGNGTLLSRAALPDCTPDPSRRGQYNVTLIRGQVCN